MVRKGTLILQRYWSVDLDSGRQTVDTFDRDIDLTDTSLQLVPKNESEIGPTAKDRHDASDCAVITQRIDEIVLWLAPSASAKPGERFCVYTSAGNVAALQLKEIRDEPRQESEFSLVVWKLPDFSSSSSALLNHAVPTRSALVVAPL